MVDISLESVEHARELHTLGMASFQERIRSIVPLEALVVVHEVLVLPEEDTTYLDAAYAILHTRLDTREAKDIRAVTSAWEQLRLGLTRSSDTNYLWRAAQSFLHREVTLEELEIAKQGTN